MKNAIPEHLLQHLWKEHEHFLQQPVQLSDGSEVIILDAGKPNTHRDGPDFLDASIAIDGVRINGNIELHRTTQDWKRHGHGSDPHYHSVILHVVLEDDEVPIDLKVPTIVLRDNLRLDRREMWQQLFERLYDRSPELKCFPHNLQLRIRTKQRLLDRYSEARLDELIERLRSLSDNLRSALYRSTMDALGFSQNRKPFTDLAEILSLRVLQQVRDVTPVNDRALTFEALYFGASGLLSMPSATYDAETNERLLELRARWEWLQTIISIPYTLHISDWAFFRIRPLNTPYRRLALAAILAERIFSNSQASISEWLTALEGEIGTGANLFWEERTSWKQALDAAHALMGEERREALALTVLTPARILLLEMEGARRSTIQELRKEWGSAPTKSSASYLNVIEQELLEAIRVKTVRSEQGALFLKRNFCDKGRCRECLIGEPLIAKGWNAEM